MNKAVLGRHTLSVTARLSKMTSWAMQGGQPLFGRAPWPVKLDRAEFERSLQRSWNVWKSHRDFLHRPEYFVSQRARQDVKVALIGQGPDELFRPGYKRHLGVVRKLVAPVANRSPSMLGLPSMGCIATKH